jgi:hypothetical protein
MSEGMADYIAFSMMIRRGQIREADRDTFMLRNALSTGQAVRCLGSLEGVITSIGVWPGDVGQIAVKRLVAQSSNGMLSLRILNQGLGAGMNFDQAFQDAFGVTKQAFYEAFPTYLASLGGPSSCS